MIRLIQPKIRLTLLGTLLIATAAPPMVSGQEALAVSSIIPSPQQPAHPLEPALLIARASLDNIRTNVEDYTALFAKRCRVDGELPATQFAKVKIRNPRFQDGAIVTPMSVYLDFLKPASVKGREVIWVQGRNDGKLIAHDGGYRNLFSLNLDPKGMLAMRGQRHPITDIGIENLAAKVIETAERDLQYGECEVSFSHDAKIGNTECTMVQVIHPTRRDHFDFYRARVYFDKARNIPIRYASWSWPETVDGEPVLEEEYTYLRVALNTGLSDLDFDSTNPAYRFR